jgi:hypothetical protein
MSAAMPRPRLATNSAQFMSKRVVLTVSGGIAADVRERITSGRRPGADYLELARSFNADLLDYAAARTIAGRTGVETIIDLVKGFFRRQCMGGGMSNVASCGGMARDVPQQIWWRTQIVSGFEQTPSVAPEGIIPRMLTLHSRIRQNLSQTWNARETSQKSRIATISDAAASGSTRLHGRPCRPIPL